MKLSRKILTFVAPIAAVATIVPIATSCGGESFSFSYGDSINCYQKLTDLPNVDVHSLGIVQSTSKANAPIWRGDTVTQTDLNSFANIKQYVYYDMVASLANCTKTPFAFAWTVNDDSSISLKYYIQDDSTVISNATFEYKYDEPSGGNYGIYIFVKESGAADSWPIESFSFKGVTVEE